jgi:hypothetical protein
LKKQPSPDLDISPNKNNERQPTGPYFGDSSYTFKGNDHQLNVQSQKSTERREARSNLEIAQID